MSNQTYLADAPLTDPDDDRLRRKPFALRIADTIVSREDPTSLVVGLFGRWGEGKTTVLNFIESRLKENDHIVAVRFNPWLYQDDKQLLMAFFETLAESIDQNLTSSKEQIGNVLRVLGGALSTVSMAFGPMSGAPGSALQAVGGVLSSDDVKKKRERLEQALAEAGKRIVVLIDDIDRLDNSEIAMVFKLVKLAADFDHTSYVLAFDRDVVAKALSKKYADSEDTGSSFIEKIVQVPLELPRADPSVLQAMTFEEIGKSIDKAGIVAVDTDLSRFSMVFYRNIAKYIETPRTAKRLANAIDFAVPLVASEVNLADLLILECLRAVLFPSSHKKIPLFKDYLLGKPFDYAITDGNKFVGAKIGELVNGLNDAVKEDVIAALRELFPRIERIFTNQHYGSESIPRWPKEQRVCAPDYFDRFFSYGIPLGDLSDSEFKDFVESLKGGEKAQSATALRELIASSSAERVIQKLRSIEKTLDASSANALAFAVAAASDLLPDPETSPLGGAMSPFTQAAMHIASLLLQLPTSERGGVVEQVIGTTLSLPFASEVLRWAHALSGDDIVLEERALSTEEIANLQRTLAKRVSEAAAETPLFLTMPRYALSLYFDWWRGDKDSVRKHLTEACSGNFENSLALLKSFVPTSWSFTTGMAIVGSSVQRPTYDSIAELMDPQTLVDAFASRFPSVGSGVPPADPENLQEDERIALRFEQIHKAVLQEKAGPPPSGGS